MTMKAAGAALFAALLGFAGASLAQASKDKDASGKRGTTLESAGKQIPEQCAGLVGHKREQCIEKHAGKGAPRR